MTPEELNDLCRRDRETACDSTTEISEDGIFQEKFIGRYNALLANYHGVMNFSSGVGFATGFFGTDHFNDLAMATTALSGAVTCLVTYGVACITGCTKANRDRLSVFGCAMGLTLGTVFNTQIIANCRDFAENTSSVIHSANFPYKGFFFSCNEEAWPDQKDKPDVV